MIVVFSSLFMDVCFPIESWPQRGDIIPAGPVTISCGGKGANQAVAAARGGSKVHMIGMVGDDDFGRQLTARLRSEGVATSGVGYNQTLATGVVGVLYEPDGMNTQIASPAANREVMDDQIPDSFFKAGTYCITGLNLPREKIEAFLKRAHGTGAVTLCNLSPIKTYNHELAPFADIIVINRDELLALASQLGLEALDDMAAVRNVVQKLQRDVIATLGADGVIALRTTGECYVLPGHKIDKVVDTNGAGDCFLGTFAAALDMGANWEAALKRSIVASALSCRKIGAMDSYPYQADIDEALMGKVATDSAA